MKEGLFYTKKINAFLILSVCLFFCSLTFLQAQEAESLTLVPPSSGVVVDENVPPLLSGLWENKSRYVVFNSDYFFSDTHGSIPQIVLRTFYQWYDDRAGESSRYTQEKNTDGTFIRDRNNTTSSRPAEELEVHYQPLTYELFPENINSPVTLNNGDELFADGEASGAWDMQIRYPKTKDIYHVPIAVIGNKLYLNFRIKQEDSSLVPHRAFVNGETVQSGNLLSGFWQDVGHANGILISPVYNSKELLSFYITNDAVYHIRYWRTDMEFAEGKQALFTVDDSLYEVPKHLQTLGKNFTCVNGRSSRIRNIERSNSLPESYRQNAVLVKKHTEDENGNPISYTVRTSTILVLGEPYLVLAEGRGSLEEIVKTENARKKPAPPPLFPPHGILDFDWSIIEDPPARYDRRMLDLGK